MMRKWKPSWSLWIRWNNNGRPIIRKSACWSSNLHARMQRLQGWRNFLTATKRKTVSSMISRHTYNTSGNVKIFMRVRPSGLNEANEAFSTSLAPAPKMKKVTLGHPPKDYKFDRVFGPSYTREEILEDMKPIIRSALDGFHVFVFAYGKIPSYWSDLILNYYHKCSSHFILRPNWKWQEPVVGANHAANRQFDFQAGRHQKLRVHHQDVSSVHREQQAPWRLHRPWPDRSRNLKLESGLSGRIHATPTANSSEKNYIQSQQS